MKRILLISSSRVHGGGYFDHVEGEIRNFFAGVRCVLFVPYALQDHEGYTQIARTRFETMGYSMESVHSAPDPVQAVRNAEGIFIGGGNTFRLLKSLYDQKLLEPIRKRVEESMPYMGSSAGTNVACPTIRTTNDMPIVEPPSLHALGLIRFQINPHYVDPDPNSTHMGETREERLIQYLEENDIPVLGLREACFLRIEQETIYLKGTTNARLFRKGADPQELSPGITLNHLLA